MVVTVYGPIVALLYKKFDIFRVKTSSLGLR